MLWEIRSGDFEAVIQATRETLQSSIANKLKTFEDGDLGRLIFMRRLTEWQDSTTPEEIESADLYISTEYLLKEFNMWQEA